AKDKSPVKYERICQKEGRQVAWDDLVKGYEYEKGKYVVLTRQDFVMVWSVMLPSAVSRRKV
ncbi:MAG TPA: Ku protein, partial [Planctomycetota bacterium]|nr:Ku protein [Planctomycetota bacterium]